MNPSSDIAFSPAVKAQQHRKGSRAGYARLEAKGGFRTAITADLAQFLATIETAYLATANADGQPYAQHRGGPKGFIRVLDDHTLGFVDFAGNRQYISTGNLAENERAFLFLMDYANQRRIKIWGRARIVEGDPDLIGHLMPDGYDAKPEQAVVFTVDAWDSNCPQHIPQLIPAADVTALTAGYRDEIKALQAENAQLRAQLSKRRD